MYNRGLSLARAVVWNINERDVCTSREFWQLIFLVLDGFFYAKTQFLSSLSNRGLSLSRAVDWNVNERFVCTSFEFWQLIFLVVDGIFFTPNLSVYLV